MQNIAFKGGAAAVRIPSHLKKPLTLFCVRIYHTNGTPEKIKSCKTALVIWLSRIIPFLHYHRVFQRQRLSVVQCSLQDIRAPLFCACSRKIFPVLFVTAVAPGLSRKCRFFCRRVVLWPVMAAELQFRPFTLPYLATFTMFFDKSTNNFQKISIFHILTQHKQTVKFSFLAALFFYSISPTFFSRPPLLPFSLL